LITFFSVNERPPKSLYAVNVNVYAPPAVNSISGFWLAADVPFTNLNVVGKMLQMYLSAKSVVVVNLTVCPIDGRCLMETKSTYDGDVGL
jgi:hypothetical protein